MVEREEGCVAVSAREERRGVFCWDTTQPYRYLCQLLTIPTCMVSTERESDLQLVVHLIRITDSHSTPHAHDSDRPLPHPPALTVPSEIMRLQTPHRFFLLLSFLCHYHPHPRLYHLMPSAQPPHQQSNATPSPDRTPVTPVTFLEGSIGRGGC